MSEKPIIWLESIIGAGKTTLLQYLSKTINVRTFDEPFEKNPYFDDSYDNPKVFASLAQIWFAIKRGEIHQLATSEALFGTQYDACVIDRGLHGDEVFERFYYNRGDIQDREHKLYKQIYRSLLSRTKAPSMLIYLDVFPEVALRRIKERGRKAEKNIDINFLNMLRDEHYDMLIRLESGNFDYTSKIVVCRIPWNVDNQDPNIIIDVVLNKFPNIKRNAS